MRAGLFLTAALLVVPVVHAQGSANGTGHIVLQASPTQVAVNSSIGRTIHLWINMTIECDPGEGNRVGFPTIHAYLSSDTTVPVTIEPRTLTFGGEFQRSAGQFGTNDRFTYSAQRNLTITVGNESAGRGSTQLGWALSSPVKSGVQVPPGCSPQGYEWEFGSADRISIAYEAVFPGETTPTPSGRARVVTGRAGNTDEILFSGESRTHQDAFIVLSSFVLVVVAVMGLYGRLRRGP